jgi:NADH-quinone oxidoreductase subunit J
MEWASQHGREIGSLVLIACGVWWLMPRASSLPKSIGLILAMAGAALMAASLNVAGDPTIRAILFCTFAGGAILSAILMITNRNPVYSALWFAMVTLAVCGLFLLQSAPFLAAATVIVYAGAIVVTFVFVIMLAQQSGATMYDQRSRQPFLATVFAIMLLAALLGTLKASNAADFQFADEQATNVAGNSLSHPRETTWLLFAEPAVGWITPVPVFAGAPLDSMLGLGRSLFGDYLFAVELAGTLLLVATIGAIAIAPRRRRGTL